MTAPAPACPDWPVVYPGGEPCPALAGLTPEQQAMFEQMAAAYLWNWTGKVLGTCPVAVRPCRSDCASAPPATFWGLGPRTQGNSALHSRGAIWGPALINGRWYNLGCGSCGDLCGCGGPESLRLPGPVSAVTEVLIDGAVLDPAAYRVDNHALLVRLDGGAWPTCQDMSADPSTVGGGAFQITYDYGLPVPPGGQIAAGVLACEMAKASSGDTSCQLPRRIQTIARQGVTMTFLDSMDDLDKGRTGIWIIDSWVASLLNPPRPSAVYSVDIPSPRQRVTTWLCSTR